MRDLFHNSVKSALINDGWIITHDPFRVEYGDIDIAIDLGAEKIFAAEKGSEKIVVEVKSFLERSMIYTFHETLGQYINYRRMLRVSNIERDIFLAVPLDAYEKFFKKEFIQITIEEEELKLLIFNPTTQSIELWIR